MPLALVETKFFRPAAAAGRSCRARASTSSSAPGGRRLTLVSAPAGFGKTTLLAAWLAGATAHGRDPAHRMGVPGRGATGGGRRSGPTCCTALDRAAPGAGAAALTLLESGQARSRRSWPTVLNELSVPAGRRRPRPRRLPPRRQPGDPAGHGVPARPPAAAGAPGHQHPRRPGAAAGPAAGAWRARRGPRRRPAVHRRRGDRLPRRRHRARARPRTTSRPWRPAPRAGSRPCSWPRSRCATATTRPRFIAGFAGDDRFVVDYLVDEVLDRQPDDVRRLPARHVDPRAAHRPPVRRGHRTTGRQRRCWSRWSGRNLFLVPLDDQRRWYRYHHLFADVLRAHLLGERPRPGRRAAPARQRVVRTRRTRPSTPSGTPSPPETSTAPPTWSSSPSRRCGAMRREAVIRRWVDALPDDVVRNRPVLAIGLVGGLMASNEFDGVDRAAGRHRAAARAARRRAGRRRPRRARPGPGRHRDVPGRPRAQHRAATRRPPSPTPSGPSTGRPRTTTWSGRPPRPCPAWRPGPSATSTPRTTRYTVALAGLEQAGHIADVLGCSIAVGRHRDHPGPPRRRAAHLRTLPRARRAARRPALRGYGRHARRAE